MPRFLHHEGLGIHVPDHHGAEDTDAEEPDGTPLTWDLDNVELTTVGVDVGSSTSHLLFARLHLQRLTQGLSSRFVVVRRDVLARSPVTLTPYCGDGLIDVAALRETFQRAYEHAGLRQDEVDTGAVILTGVALERRNSRAVAELFADTGGRFVCASAGHNLEAILAAHGSGAAASTVGDATPRLHVDVGGGTTKLALVAGGEVLETAAVGVGGRLVVLDAWGRVVRVEDAARPLAAAAGVALEEGAPLDTGARRRLCEAMARILVDAACGDAGGVGEQLLLTPPLQGRGQGDTVTCSGGVSEYLGGAGRSSPGDLGPELAAACSATFSARGLRLKALPQGIRATVVGASQFTVQLSGSTVHLPREGLLPLRNLPVLSPRLPPDREPTAALVTEAIGAARRRLDLTETAPVAVALRLPGEPHHRLLRELACGVADALADHLARRLPVVVALDADLGRSLGRVLAEERGPQENLVVIDGLELLELDYVDVGEVVRPAGVVPVVIKSLAFGGRRSSE
jgi:ethanolamine utilization protein EutA